MSVYHQMGHHSDNLLDMPELKKFSGAILSPTNYQVTEIAAQIAKHKDKQNFEMIFDPQLYYPQSERGVLKNWAYFPEEIDSADLSSEAWWNTLNENLLATIKGLGPHTVCSPVAVPRTYSNSYYAVTTNVADSLVEKCKERNFKVLNTVLVGLDEIAQPNRALAIASIVSRTAADGIYLILIGDTEPRRELADTEALKGVMRLIFELQNSGMRIIVGYSSSDMILWKAAGATSCATGKFFNLRRFTKSRWEEPSGGGGQLPYWFEESLFAFLRESDILRVEKESLLSQSSLENPVGNEIRTVFNTKPGSAWLALSWRQYLYWFADLENRITQDISIAKGLLRDADNNWGTLEDKEVLMEERKNNGQWLRAWRRALVEYLKD